MDNLTHGLLAAAIGMARPREGGPETGLLPTPTETDRAVIIACVLAGELPDIDVFSGLIFGGGPLAEYVYHRGITHALVAAPVIALIAAGLTRALFRKARFATLFGWSLIAVLVAHLFNDWLTGWGTRLLLPFSDARVGLDWVAIVDPFYTLPLLVAVLMGLRKPLLRRRWITGALAYLLIYAVGYRGLSHTMVQQAVEQAYADQPVANLRVAAPLLNPVAWSYTVDLGDRYEQGQAVPFGPVTAVRVIPKREDQVTAAVRALPDLKPFFDQFAFPLITYAPQPDGYLVDLADVRYSFAGRSMGHRLHLTADFQQVEFLTDGN